MNDVTLKNVRFIIKRDRSLLREYDYVKCNSNISFKKHDFIRKNNFYLRNKIAFFKNLLDVCNEV